MSLARQLGVGLVELLVATVVSMVVMLIAIQMLAEAGLLLSSAQVEFAEPSARLATQWLRRDVQAASGVEQWTFAPSSGPMDLQGHEEGTLRYEKIGSDLDRVILAADGEEIGRRTVLRGVAAWRWRALNTAVVEVEIVHRRRERLAWARRDASPTETARSERRRFALRGRLQGSW